jgi:hypothetical protein
MDDGAIEKRGSTRGPGDFLLRACLDAHPPTPSTASSALQTTKSANSPQK